MKLKLKNNECDVLQDASEFQTDKLCKIINSIGWYYDQRFNELQLTFKAPEDCIVNQSYCMLYALANKLGVTATLGIKTENRMEMLSLINYINWKKIYFGKYILLDDGEIWFDTEWDLTLHELDSDLLYKAVQIANSTIIYFSRIIAMVAYGSKTAQEAIKELE